MSEKTQDQERAELLYKWEQLCDDAEGLLEKIQEIDQALEKAHGLTNEATDFARAYQEDFPQMQGQLKYYITNNITAIRESNTINLLGIMNGIRKQIREAAEADNLPVPDWAAEDK